MKYNSATKAIEVAYKKASNELKSPTGVTFIPMWKATAGTIAEKVGFSTPVLPDGIGKLSKAQAMNLATVIHKQLYVGADHANVKDNQEWKRMYQSDVRPVYRMDNTGTVANGYKTDTVPCHNCGLVLPFSDVQIDHHMPQVGGNYVLKMFRALGLTVAPSTGSKGMAIANSTLNALVMNPKGRDPGDYDHLSNPTTADKWTTNDKGDVFLSLFAYVGVLDDLGTWCKNSLLNLVPLCRACNGVKSDWVKPIS